MSRITAVVYCTTAFARVWDGFSLPRDQSYRSAIQEIRELGLLDPRSPEEITECFRVGAQLAVNKLVSLDRWNPSLLNRKSLGVSMAERLAGLNVDIPRN